MSNIVLSCEHVRRNLACHFAQTSKAVQCQVLMETVMQGYKHIAKICCYAFSLLANHSCSASCDAAFECDHDCKQICKNCTTRDEDDHISTANHDVCKTLCDKSYIICSHACSKTCHKQKSCRLCVKSCEVRCTHSRCSKKCHESYISCVENCSWSCSHRDACKLLYTVLCDLLSCSKRCSLILSYNHQCSDVCEEICSKIQHCQQYVDKLIKDIMIDYIMKFFYAEFELDEVSCLISSYNHILTLESMNNHMNMSNYYTMFSDFNIENSIVALKSISISFSILKLKNCSLYRKPFRNINRYSRIIRRAWIDEAIKKFIVWTNAQFVLLVSRMK